MKESRKGRYLFIRLGLGITSAIVTFLIIELVLRVGFRDTILLFPRYTTAANYGEFTIRRIRPNSVFWHTSLDGSWRFSTNSQGFRNYVDFEYAKPEGVTRIVILGDSQTQGYEVRQEYTYSAIVEKYLTQRGRHVEVMNTGVSGFGTAEELVLLENEMVKYHPDIVVLGFYKNDFEDNIRSDLFELDPQNSLVVKNRAYIPGVKIQNLVYSLPLTKWLSENSYAYSFVFNGAWDYFKAISINNARDFAREYAVPTQADIPDYQTLYTSKLIERMYQFCHDHRILLIIVDVPTVDGSREDQEYSSSFPPALLSTIEHYSDADISSDDVLSDYEGAAEIFVPHGANHIGEFTHTLIGVAIAKEIEILER